MFTLINLQNTLPLKNTNERNYCVIVKQEISFDQETHTICANKIDDNYINSNATGSYCF